MDQDPRDVDAIKQLKARYFRYMDTKQWDKWRTVFADDCKYEGTRRNWSGPDEFVAENSKWLGPAMTIHQGHMPEIVITGDGTARGIWAMFDWVEWPEASDPNESGTGGQAGFIGYGHYEEEYRKVDGEWKIALLRLTRLRIHPLDEHLAKADFRLGSAGRDWLTM